MKAATKPEQPQKGALWHYCAQTSPSRLTLNATLGKEKYSLDNLVHLSRNSFFSFTKPLKTNGQFHFVTLLRI